MGAKKTDVSKKCERKAVYMPTHSDVMNPEQ